MKSAFDLHDSRIDRVVVADGEALVHFVHAYIHKSKGTPGRDPGTEWSQEALLRILSAEICGPWPTLPNTIADGFLEVAGIKHTLLPLPFTRKVALHLSLLFGDATRLEIRGKGASVELLGTATYLEDSQ